MENNARKWAGTAAMAAAILGAAVASAHAQSGRRVVLQVEYRVPPTPRVIRMMTMAQDEATRIYDAIGVMLVWTDGSTPVGTADDLRFTVGLLSDARTYRFLQDSRNQPHVLGAAPCETGRVYLFFDRILRQAAKDFALPHVVLGRVLAHEVGHHLLPARGHSSRGLMRAPLDYRTPVLPTFTAEELESIRALLMASN